MKNKLTKHADHRYFDRSNQNISRKDLIKYIGNGGQIHYAKRMTSTRSLAYIPIKNEVFKVIINRKSKCIVSILPFKDEYIKRLKVYSEYYDNKIYLIELYPDCYMETNEPHALTQIFIVTDKNNELLHFEHPFFNGLFNAAWKIYLGMKGLMKNEQIKITAETQTYTITTDKLNLWL